MDAKKIFVYGNSYATRTLLFHIEHLLDFEISDVYVLSENHKTDEEFVISEHICIHRRERIEEVLPEIDIVLALKDENSPMNKLNAIVQAAEKMHFACFVIDNPWQNYNSSKSLSTIENEVLTDEHRTKPVVLNISVGRYPQQYCTEIALNKIFTNEKLSFKQHYSYETKKLIFQLNNIGIAKKDLILPAQNTDEGSLIIHSIHIEDIVDASAEQYFFNNITPDCIVLSCMLSWRGLSDLRNLLKVKYNLMIDFVAVSPYIEFEKCSNDYSALYAGNSVAMDGISNQTHDFEQRLKNSIFGKIATPEGVHIIR